MVRFDSERQKLFRAMQLSGVETPVVDVDVAVDRHVTRVPAQTGHLGVVADLDDERVGGRPVDTGLEQQGVALGPHLVVDLLRVDRVGGGLDLGRRHARVEHLDVRSEVDRPGPGRGGRRRRIHRAGHEPGQQESEEAGQHTGEGPRRRGSAHVRNIPCESALRKSGAEPVQPGAVADEVPGELGDRPRRPRSATAGCRRRGSSRRPARRSPPAGRGRPRRRAGRRSRGRPRGRRRGTRPAADRRRSRSAGRTARAARVATASIRAGDALSSSLLTERSVNVARPAPPPPPPAWPDPAFVTPERPGGHVDLLGVAGVGGLALDAVQLEEHRHGSTPRLVSDTRTPEGWHRAGWVGRRQDEIS